jgi:hypothetical protein
VQVFINDLSLHEQFPDSNAFLQALSEVLHCRDCVAAYEQRCVVPRNIVHALVTPGRTFREVVQSMNDTNFKRLIFSWLDKNGPFVDDDLTRDANEYFTYGADEQVVTDTVLGEVATRFFADQLVATLSFAPSQFIITPLEISWHRDTMQVEQCFIDNFYDQATLAAYLSNLQAEARTWPELLKQVQAKYAQLTFLENLEQYLDGRPFSPAVARRVFELLAVLNRLKMCFDEQGRRTAEGEDLLDKHFRRKNAVFTDASDSEKNDPVFRQQMTFRDPAGESLECFWHGKISSQVFRIHFSYPIQPDKPLVIAYIGPKRTKR